MRLNIDQRAFVVGDQGICPECEEKVEWDDIDTNWYICHGCVLQLLHGGPSHVAIQKLRDLQLPS